MNDSQRQPPEKLRLTDRVQAVLGKLTGKAWSRDPKEKLRTRANVLVQLYGSDGTLKYQEVGENLVTDYGDEVIATRLYDDAVDIVSGMRLGTGATAASKSGAGGAIVTYVSGSNEALDSTATDASKGAGLGHRTTYVCTWVAGDITESALAEVVLTNETPLTDVAGAVGNTVARYVFGSTIDKQSGDSLTVTWQIDVLGA